MCLVAIASHAHPDWPLVLAGNRDERHARPSDPAHWWLAAPQVFGGRDLMAGGSWLAADLRGRFAVVTNIPGAPAPAGAPSRGGLVSDYLAGGQSAAEYAAALAGLVHRYAGFHLVLGDGRQTFTLGGPTPAPGQPRAPAPGILTLTNATDSRPWPKADYLAAALRAWLADPRPGAAGLLASLERRAPVSGGSEALPAVAATPFVLHPVYGTRSASVLLRHRSGVMEFIERRYDARGECTGQTLARFPVADL